MIYKDLLLLNYHFINVLNASCHILEEWKNVMGKINKMDNNLNKKILFVENALFKNLLY